MTPQLALLKLRLRLNKLHSSDYDDVPDWTAMEAINKATLEWVRRTVSGSNAAQAGDEETRMRVDDLQVLLNPVPLVIKGINRPSYFLSKPLPANYLYMKKITPIVSKGICTNVPLSTRQIEESNSGDYISDFNLKPSMEWDQSFFTMTGGRVKVYTAGDFHVEQIELTYYRKPNRVDIEGYTREDGSQSISTDLELKDDVCELILDDAAAIIATSVESYNQAQAAKQRADQNT